jgi:hypothetical protein
MSAVDVRGGICGGTDKTGLCGLPLFWGRCEHHGLRVAVDPMPPARTVWPAAEEAREAASRSGLKLTKDGRIDTRYLAGRKWLAAQRPVVTK